MNEFAKLLDAFSSGTLLHPSHGSYNIVDLGNAIGYLNRASNIKLNAGTKRILDILGSPQHLIFILADGLGTSLVRNLDHSSFLNRHVISNFRTAFPSTTPVVLTSLATGHWPSKHGVTGWYTYLPDYNVISTIIKFVKKSDGLSLDTLGAVPDKVFPVPSLFSRFATNALSLIPSHLANTTYSKYFSGSVPILSYETLDEAFEIIITQLNQPKNPTFTYLYTPKIDSAAHSFGTSEPRTLDAICTFERKIESLASHLPSNTKLVLTADHGLLDAEPGAIHNIDPNDELVNLLEGPVWGDSRICYFNEREQNRLHFQEIFKARFGDLFILITREEAKYSGIFGKGKPSPISSNRIGNLMAISMGTSVINFTSHHQLEHTHAKVGYHSGLTPDEMLIPLIVI